MKRQILTGKIQGNERGYAFLIIPDSNVDYFIPHSDLRGAMHGDTVLAETTDGVGNRTTARVLKIIERGIDRITGTYFSKRTGGFVVPDESKFSNDVFVPFSKGIRAKSGDKVVCKITSYPKHKSPEGMIIKILGRQFEKNAELKSILYSYKLPEGFSKSVLKECDTLSDSISNSEIRKRKDFRDKLIFTVDGEYSKDFDDAISLEKTKDGYIVGIHIADVSHYVKQDSEIDREAFKRGTSVYFPESVIPMLPEKLSNDLCSLVKGKDRLTLSCVVKISKSGKVLDKEITQSVIKSTDRLTYTEVDKMLDGDEQIIKKHDKVYKTILEMDKVSNTLKGIREEKGCIDLDVKESSITVDKNGNIKVEPSVNDRAHKIIEEFMILANRTVAEYVYYLDIPFVYRVHGKPTEERLENFYAFLLGLGVNPKRKKDEVFSKDFQLILKDAENKPTYSIINRVMLRSMQKAKYSPELLGHFGLGEKFYCHFTSPIRRYPDLAIHRIIKDLLNNGIDGLEDKYRAFVESSSIQSSECEKKAMEVERKVDDYYKILYISDFEGEEFEGFVSGVMAFGVFVELYNGVEGLVKLETLKGGRYVFDSSKYLLSNGKNSYRLGEKVNIRVLGVDIIEKRAQFEIIDCDKSKNIVK